jgi:hypothetical protein
VEISPSQQPIPSPTVSSRTKISTPSTASLLSHTTASPLTISSLTTATTPTTTTIGKLANGHHGFSLSAIIAIIVSLIILFLIVIAYVYYLFARRVRRTDKLTSYFSIGRSSPYQERFPKPFYLQPRRSPPHNTNALQLSMNSEVPFHVLDIHPPPSATSHDDHSPLTPKFRREEIVSSSSPDVEKRSQTSVTELRMEDGRIGSAITLPIRPPKNALRNLGSNNNYEDANPNHSN